MKYENYTEEKRIVAKIWGIEESLEDILKATMIIVLTEEIKSLKYEIEALKYELGKL